MPSPALSPALQAAGHPGAQQGGGLFVKPSTQNEVDFYHEIIHRQSALIDYTPTFMGTLTSDAQEASINLVLRDIVYGFKKPSIGDIKIGSQLWHEGMPLEKQQKRMELSRDTTSGSLKFRIAGMSVVEAGDRITFDKEFGRAATRHDIVERLGRLFPNRENEYVQSVIRAVVARLQEIQEVVERENVETHSASVLIVYEGDLQELARKVEGQSIEPQPEPKPESEPDQKPEPDQEQQSSSESSESAESSDESSEPDTIVEVCLIDFAHTHFGSEPHWDSIEGLKNLKSCMDELIER